MMIVMIMIMMIMPIVGLFHGLFSSFALLKRLTNKTESLIGLPVTISQSIDRSINLPILTFDKCKPQSNNQSNHLINQSINHCTAHFGFLKNTT